MFQVNEIVEVDLEGYRKWYQTHVRSGVWMLEELLCYVEGMADDGGSAHIHELTGCIGCWNTPIEFLKSTGRLYVPAEESDEVQS